MTEEKKESKDKKKLKYEMPKLVKLNGVAAEGNGACADGSGDAVCETGNGATTNCDNGNTATNFCTSGGTGNGGG